MLIQNYHNDSEKVQLLSLLAEIRALQKNMGGYIEHFYHNENTIIIKLTNGVLKIEEQLLESYTIKDAKLDANEIEKLAGDFVISTMA